MDQIVTRTAELIETEVDGDIVALDVEHGTCFGFNATASRIWALTAEPVTVSTIVAQLVADFEVEAATCQREVDAMLETMREQRLVRLAPAD